MNEFQHWFAAKRAELGLSYEAIAGRCGISAQYAHQIEAGKRTPDEEVARKIARGLGEDELRLMLMARRSKSSPEVRQALTEESLRRALGSPDPMPPPGMEGVEELRVMLLMKGLTKEQKLRLLGWVEAKVEELKKKG